MIEIQYSTGQASGITRIPIRTIQAYVKDFRDFFSEAARQPSKGRRFTDADIDKLQTIQRLRADRVTDEEIRKVLSGETPLKLAHQYDEAELKKFAANLLENYETAMQTFEVSQKMLEQAQAAIYAMREENRQLREDNKTWKSRVDDIRKWQIFVMKDFPELNPYIHEDEPEPITQEGQEANSKGFIARLFGG